MAMPTLIEHYREATLQSRVVELYPALYDIVAGNPDESGRLQAFLKGGKARLSLAQRVGPGRFSRAQYALINSMLQAEFLPDLCTTKTVDFTQERAARIETSMEPLGALSTCARLGPPMKQEGDVTKEFSDQMRLHFVADVLLPEAIARLTMERDGTSYEEAERNIQDCARDDCTDTWWVDDVLAARESFLDGGAQ